MDKKRIDYFDISKGIGILCIIIGHMGVETISRIVFTFHVPLFFLISGFFISNKGTYFEYAKKKFKGLICPYMFTSLLLIFIRIPINIVNVTPYNIIPEMKNVFICALYGSGSIYNKTLFNIRLIGAIWFLLALFWSLLLVRLLIDIKNGWIIIVCVALISYYSSKYVWLPFDIQAGGVASIFVYTGAVIKKYKNDIFDNINWFLFILGLLSFIYCYCYNTNLSIVRNYYSNGIVSIIFSILICFFIIYLSKIIEFSKVTKKVLLFFGKNSVIVLCFHLVELNNFNFTILFDKYNFNLSTYTQIILLFVIKIMFITVCTLIVLRVKFLRKIFLK